MRPVRALLRRPFARAALLAGALAALGLLRAAPARADVVVLDDGTELHGQVVVIGSRVQVHTFDGVRTVPRARIARMTTDREGRAPPPAELDADGLFALALDAERRGDFGRAVALRRLAAERELRRRAALLGADDDAGWERLAAQAAVLDLSLAFVRILRLEARAGRLEQPGAVDEALAARRDADDAASPLDDEPEELAWRAQRSARTVSGMPVVVIIPGRGVLPPPSIEAPSYIRFVGGIGGGGSKPPGSRPRTRTPGGETFGAASRTAGETFRAANAGGRSTFDALSNARRVTAGAAGAQAGSTFRALNGR